MATTRQRFTFNTGPAALIGGQPDVGTGFRQGLTGIADVLLKNRDYAAALAEARSRSDLAREGLAFRNDQAAQEQQRWEAEHQLAVRNADLLAQKEAFDEAHPPYQPPPMWLPSTDPNAPKGAVAPAPGSPGDPDYQKRLAEAKAKTPGTRPLSPTGSKMTKDAGEALYNTAFSLNTWKPEYGGNYGLGEMGVDFRAKVMGDQTAKEAQNWWSTYRGYVQAIRKNQLYGAALSPTEQASFDSFEVSPTMRPEQIKANLQHQHDIVERASTTVAGQLLAGGADPTAVEQQIGIRLDSLGFKLTRDPKTNRIISIDAFPVVLGAEDVGAAGVSDPNRDLGGS